MTSSSSGMYSVGVDVDKELLDYEVVVVVVVIIMEDSSDVHPGRMTKVEVDIHQG